VNSFPLTRFFYLSPDRVHVRPAQMAIVSPKIQMVDLFFEEPFSPIFGGSLLFLSFFWEITAFLLADMTFREKD